VTADLSRRDFLKVVGAAGVVAGTLGSGPLANRALAKAAEPPQPGLNILFIMVDQMRTPWEFMPPALAKATVPTIMGLANEGVAFSQYYASSNDCTPSRTTQATGLYTHQTAIFATTPPTNLNPGFPTFGTMLRQQGYDTYWFGKWHMSGGSNGDCSPADASPAEKAQPYDKYGFSVFPGSDPPGTLSLADGTNPLGGTVLGAAGASFVGSGTCPSPNGGPGMGLAMDPIIRQQFVNWLSSRPQQGGKPWMSVVSFVNPHDIAWYPRWTRGLAGERAALPLYSGLPGNFETRRDRALHRKPTLQSRLMQLENEAFGHMPEDGTPPRLWSKMLDTYVRMQYDVDIQIAQVLRALKASAFANNTLVVFTSDHGEYGGAHGMRGKGMAFYDEGVRVPLIVKDPTKTWTKAIGQKRNHLVESVDLAAMFMTFATGSNDWRGDSTYAQIANRADIAGICVNPKTPGRPYVAYATDEPGTAALVPDAQSLAPAPNHIMGIRTPGGKYAQYAFWKDGTLTVDTQHLIQYEAYDYRTKGGRSEMDNVYRAKRMSRENTAFVRRMEALLDRAIETEIQAPVPPALQAAQDAAMNTWFTNSPSALNAGWTRDTVN
jgi:arylsulfatase A-like enzyme